MPVQNAVLFASALAEQGVKTEMHLYPNGPHGISLASDLTADPAGAGRMIVPEVQSWLGHTVRFMIKETMKA